MSSSYSSNNRNNRGGNNGNNRSGANNSNRGASRQPQVPMGLSPVGCDVNGSPISAASASRGGGGGSNTNNNRQHTTPQMQQHGHHRATSSSATASPSPSAASISASHFSPNVAAEPFTPSFILQRQQQQQNHQHYDPQQQQQRNSAKIPSPSSLGEPQNGVTYQFGLGNSLGNGGGALGSTLLGSGHHNGSLLLSNATAASGRSSPQSAYNNNANNGRSPHSNYHHTGHNRQQQQAAYPYGVVDNTNASNSNGGGGDNAALRYNSIDALSDYFGNTTPSRGNTPSMHGRTGSFQAIETATLHLPPAGATAGGGGGLIGSPAPSIGGLGASMTSTGSVAPMGGVMMAPSLSLGLTPRSHAHGGPSASSPSGGGGGGSSYSHSHGGGMAGGPSASMGGLGGGGPAGSSSVLLVATNSWLNGQHDTAEKAIRRVLWDGNVNNVEFDIGLSAPLGIGHNSTMLMQGGGGMTSPAPSPAGGAVGDSIEGADDATTTNPTVSGGGLAPPSHNGMAANAAPFLPSIASMLHGRNGKPSATAHLSGASALSAAMAGVGVGAASPAALFARMAAASFFYHTNLQQQQQQAAAAAGAGGIGALPISMLAPVGLGSQHLTMGSGAHPPVPAGMSSSSTSSTTAAAANSNNNTANNNHNSGGVEGLNSSVHNASSDSLVELASAAANGNKSAAAAHAEKIAAASANVSQAITSYMPLLTFVANTTASAASSAPSSLVGLPTPPYHRVQTIRYRGVPVWEKGRRVDFLASLLEHAAASTYPAGSMQALGFTHHHQQVRAAAAAAAAAAQLAAASSPTPPAQALLNAKKGPWTQRFPDAPPALGGSSPPTITPANTPNLGPSGMPYGRSYLVDLFKAAGQVVGVMPPTLQQQQQQQSACRSRSEQQFSLGSGSPYQIGGGAGGRSLSASSTPAKGSPMLACALLPPATAGIGSTSPSSPAALPNNGNSANSNALTPSSAAMVKKYGGVLTFAQKKVLLAAQPSTRPPTPRDVALPPLCSDADAAVVTAASPELRQHEQHQGVALAAAAPPQALSSLSAPAAVDSPPTARPTTPSVWGSAAATAAAASSRHVSPPPPAAIGVGGDDGFSLPTLSLLHGGAVNNNSHHHHHASYPLPSAAGSSGSRLTTASPPPPPLGCGSSGGPPMAIGQATLADIVSGTLLTPTPSSSSAVVHGASSCSPPPHIANQPKNAWNKALITSAAGPANNGTNGGSNSNSVTPTPPPPAGSLAKQQPPAPVPPCSSSMSDSGGASTTTPRSLKPKAPKVIVVSDPAEVAAMEAAAAATANKQQQQHSLKNGSAASTLSATRGVTPIGSAAASSSLCVPPVAVGGSPVLAMVAPLGGGHSSSTASSSAAISPSLPPNSGAVGGSALTPNTRMAIASVDDIPLAPLPASNVANNTIAANSSPAVVSPPPQSAAAAAPPSALISTFPQHLSSVRVATFNILFELYDDPKTQYYARERIPLIIKALEGTDADVIGLQEVTPFLFSQIREGSRLLREEYYWTVLPATINEGRDKNLFNQIILSRFPILDAAYLKLDRYKRCLFALLLNHTSPTAHSNPSENIFVVANSHLKSDYGTNSGGNSYVRGNELKEIFHILSAPPPLMSPFAPHTNASTNAAGSPQTHQSHPTIAGGGFSGVFGNALNNSINNNSNTNNSSSSPASPLNGVGGGGVQNSSSSSYAAALARRSSAAASGTTPQGSLGIGYSNVAMNNTNNTSNSNNNNAGPQPIGFDGLSSTTSSGHGTAAGLVNMNSSDLASIGDIAANTGCGGVVRSDSLLGATAAFSGGSGVGNKAPSAAVLAARLRSVASATNMKGAAGGMMSTPMSSSSATNVLLGSGGLLVSTADAPTAAPSMSSNSVNQALLLQGSTMSVGEMTAAAVGSDVSSASSPVTGHSSSAGAGGTATTTADGGTNTHTPVLVTSIAHVASALADTLAATAAPSSVAASFDLATRALNAQPPLEALALHKLPAILLGDFNQNEDETHTHTFNGCWDTAFTDAHLASRPEEERRAGKTKPTYVSNIGNFLVCPIVPPLRCDRITARGMVVPPADQCDFQLFAKEPTKQWVLGTMNPSLDHNSVFEKRTFAEGEVIPNLVRRQQQQQQQVLAVATAPAAAKSTVAAPAVATVTTTTARAVPLVSPSASSANLHPEASTAPTNIHTPTTPTGDEERDSLLNREGTIAPGDVTTFGSHSTATASSSLLPPVPSPILGPMGMGDGDDTPLLKPSSAQKAHPRGGRPLSALATVPFTAQPSPAVPPVMMGSVDDGVGGLPPPATATVASVTTGCHITSGGPNATSSNSINRGAVAAVGSGGVGSQQQHPTVLHHRIVDDGFSDSDDDDDDDHHRDGARRRTRDGDIVAGPGGETRWLVDLYPSDHFGVVCNLQWPLAWQQSYQAHFVRTLEQRQEEQQQLLSHGHHHHPHSASQSNRRGSAGGASSGAAMPRAATALGGANASTPRRPPPPSVTSGNSSNARRR